MTTTDGEIMPVQETLPNTDADTGEDLAARLLRNFREVRHATELLCEPLSPEDCVVQSMPDASPAKWHLAHTTWFFETFALAQLGERFVPFDKEFSYLFNSYYNAIGERHPRPQRGLLTRPSLEQVYQYRRFVDEQIETALAAGTATGLLSVIEIGIHHEQQHQELLLTDIKHLLSCNPLQPAYRTSVEVEECHASTMPMKQWKRYDGGIFFIGHDSGDFSYDNERPAHQVYLHDFELASRPVTNGEYLMFIEQRGYERPEFWLSDGWDAVVSLGWNAPMYWEKRDDAWWQFTLNGAQPIEADEPVCHVSFYEADAYAHWADARLPTEQEWEVASRDVSVAGNFVESMHYRPVSARHSEQTLDQMFGDAWEWTASPYVAYPGYQAPAGALGEYNGKFMCNQVVLRGGSCATPQSHIRRTYRNFFKPDARWQFSGIRLARDV